MASIGGDAKELRIDVTTERTLGLYDLSRSTVEAFFEDNSNLISRGHEKTIRTLTAWKKGAEGKEEEAPSPFF